jgi:phenylpropionate dioxygenase-like ring-hydroxylating dioxygenase large terminal subunit
MTTDVRDDRQGLEAVPDDRVVDNKVYYDPAVFEVERAKVIERSWMLVAHESEVAETGDFVTANIVGSEILINRDSENVVRGFFNTCRHRGSLVVTEERGHAAFFRCPYHFWCYSLNGDLNSIPGEEAYENSGFEKSKSGLVPVRTEVLFGLIFVNVSGDAPPLREWLGGVVDILEQPMGKVDLEVFDRIELPTKANWKVFAENARDGYHVPFVHPFFRKASPPGEYHLHDNGHAVQQLGVDPKGIEPEVWEQIRKYPLPGVEEGEGYIVNIFPDMAITLRYNMLSLDWQRYDGPDEVTLESRILGMKGDTPEMRQARKASHAAWFQNPVELEDHPIFEAQQRGVRSRGVRWSVIARGEDKMAGTRGDDNRLRHFWVKWREMMDTSGNSLGA